jgi:transmembrane sensor
MTLSPKAQAIAFFVALTAPGGESGVWRVFQIWLNACPENRQAFREVEDAWLLSDCEELQGHAADPSGQASASAPAWVSPEAGKRPYPRLGHKRQLSLAGFMVLWLFLAPVFAPFPQVTTSAITDTAWSRWKTRPQDQPTTFTLPDESTVQLEPNSVVDFRVTSDRCEFVLERGRALFEVRHNPRRSLEVKVGATSVVAMGTVFSVARDDHDESVTVVNRGEVMVIPGSSHTRQLLGPGQAVRVSDDQMHPEAHMVLSTRRNHWLQVVFDFDGMPLSQAVEAFNRNNKRQLAIVEPRLRDARIGGQFLANDPEGFAQALSDMGTARVVGADSKSGVIRLGVPGQ